ncbi:glycosyl hydrolase 115 family protein, partial [uncultured Muribaculum sp.]
DYLWLNTTAPMLMYEELKKAYDTDADRYWLLNVGDIKPMELAVQTFFDMAWDFDRFNYENINRRQSAFLGSIFGDEYTPDFQEILDQYYRLAWSRKPEFMGWEREWDSPEYTGLKDPEYSFDNYNEAVTRLKEYGDIADRCRELYDKLPAEYKASFFELLGYPVMASSQMNRKFLMSKLNHKMTEAKEYGKANWAALQSQQAYDSINALSHKYNTQLDGKWNGMMALPIGWVALYQKMPEVKFHDGYSPETVDLSIDKSKEIPVGYAVIPVDSYKSSNCGPGHTIRILEGIGYDWKSLQLGEPLQPLSSIDDDSCLRVDYQLPVIDSDSITVTLYTLPRFPLYKGAESKFAMVVDGNEPVIFDDILKEWSLDWKDQVLQNGKANKASFRIASPRKPATLSILAQDPGLIIQRIIIDYGGLKESYIGPRPQD